MESAAEIAVLPAQRDRFQETFLDTPAWTLYQAGRTLALRDTPGGARAILRPRLDTGDEGCLVPVLLERVPGGGLENLLRAGGPISGRLRLLRVRAGDLEVVFRVRTTRESFRVLRHGRDEGRIILERTTLLGESDTGPLLAIEVEPEANAEGGRIAAAERLSALVAAVAGRVPGAGESRVAWALAQRGLAPAIGPDLGPTAVVAGMTAAEAAFAVLRRHGASFLRHEPGTRLGDDPEHLHDMRVATRRMRSALRVFAEALPPEESARLREELREAGRVLGRVRDLDVQIEEMRGWAAEMVNVPPEAAEALLDGLRRERENAREALLAYLDSRRFHRLKASLTRRLRRGPYRQRGRGAPPEAASVPIERAGPRWVRQARRRVRKCGDRIQAASEPGEYHALRIRCKRFRYALEFLEPLHGPPARRLIEALVELQDLLGQHQDAQVALAFLRDSVRGRKRLRSENLAAAGELAQIVSALALRLRKSFPKAYRRLRGRRWKDWKKVAQAVAPRRGSADLCGIGAASQPLEKSLGDDPSALGPMH